jgi:hypothetical protein
MRISLRVFPLVLSSLLGGCQLGQAPATGRLYPDTGEAAGWERSGEPRTFTADNLWQFIDGDAERYTQAGVEQTIAVDYRFSGQAEAQVEIHVMKTAGGAAKVFDSHHSEGSRAVELGDAARLYQGSLLFRWGRYFVRIVAYSGGPEMGDALVALGRAILRRLGQ